MRELLEFLLNNLLGEGRFTIKEEDNGNFVNFLISCQPEETGLVIGKGGSTIKSIRNLLRVRATLEKKGVALSVNQ